MLVNMFSTTRMFKFLFRMAINANGRELVTRSFTASRSSLVNANDADVQVACFRPINEKPESIVSFSF